jgi:hypothetical protein
MTSFAPPQSFILLFPGTIIAAALIKAMERRSANSVHEILDATSIPIIELMVINYLLGDL